MNTTKAVVNTLLASPNALMGVAAATAVVGLLVTFALRSETYVDDMLVLIAGVWIAKIVYLQPDYICKLVEFLVPEVVFHIPVGERMAALTIDDVPLLDNPTNFKEILDVMKKHSVTATLFIMSGFILPPEKGGMQDEKREQCLALLRRAVAEGHELGNHLQFDKPAIVMSPVDFDAAFLHCDKLISEIHGSEKWKARAKHWFRPASAVWNRHILATARAKGYTTVIANCFPHDVAAVTRHINPTYLIKRARPGAVIVVHDRWHTPTTLDKALPKIAKHGLKLGTLSALQAVADAKAGGKKSR